MLYLKVHNRSHQLRGIPNRSEQNASYPIIWLNRMSRPMGKTAADGSQLKHINIKQRTHDLLNDLGSRGETMDDIVWRLLNEVVEHRNSNENGGDL